MKLSSLSLSQRLAAGLGCVVILVLFVAGVLYFSFDVISRRHIRAAMDQSPAGWSDSLRLLGRPIDLSGLTLARTEPGDAAGIVYDSMQYWHAGNVEDPYKSIVGGSGTKADSLLWRAIAADTGLDRFVAASRRREWRALNHVLGDSATSGRSVMALRLPHYSLIRNAARGLVIRALWRAMRGDVAAARTDLGAAAGLGEQMFRREPTAVGTVMGRSVLLSAAHGWERFGTLTHDTALAARGARIELWAARQIGRTSQLLIIAPDTALALAGDTALVLGMRSEALTDVLAGWMLRPRGFVFGPPRRFLDGIGALANDPDRDFARLAAMARASAARMNLFGIADLVRDAQREAQ